MKRLKLQNRTIRALVLLAAFAVFSLIFVLRLIQLQIFQYNQWSIRSKKNHVSKRVLDMKRGTITDRKGVELAISVDNYSVFIYTRELKSLTEAATLLSSVLPMTREEIIDKIGSKNGYIPIMKGLEPNLALKLKKLNIPGVKLESEYKRYYPQKSLASNLLGFTGTDKHGLEGLELFFDKTLRGYPGLAAQEDISLSESGPAKMRIIRPPMGGSNIKLTIDSFIQHILETELAKLTKQYEPIDASAIAMDPYTGEILGMACIPNYDLNNFGSSKPAERRNRPLVDVFEPGSCMKIIAAASAMESNKIDSGTRFYCKGYGELNGRRVRCHGAHGLVDISEAISESCNAAMVQVSQLVEPGQLYRTYKQFGFGAPTGIDSPSESAGTLRPPSKWSGFSATSLCIGQEMSTTAIQLIAAYSAIANGGELLRPRIVKRITSPNDDIKSDFSKELVRRVISPEIAKKLRKYLMGVVETGTGRLVKIDDYTIGGKTSTAQKANPAGGYFNDKVVVSFIGMAPALDPKIVLFVVVNEPKGDEKTLFGGTVTGRTFAIIIDRVLKYLKVPPDKSPSLISQQIKMLENNKNEKTEIIKLPNMLAINETPISTGTPAIKECKTVPDFKGKSLKEVVKTISDLKLKGLYEGNGIAVSQKPAPGTPLPESKALLITFSPKFED